MPSLALILGIGSIILGAACAVFERRVLRRLTELRDNGATDSRAKRFYQERALRRLKMGLWILLQGMTVVAGETIEPHEQPILYIGSWSAAAIVAVVLVRLAAIDYIALRRHWGGEILRNETEIERARNELRRRLGPDADHFPSRTGND